jgi:hypothetical protein
MQTLLKDNLETPSKVKYELSRPRKSTLVAFFLKKFVCTRSYVQEYSPHAACCPSQTLVTLLNPSSATTQLCDLKQVTQVSVPHFYFQHLWSGDNYLILTRLW